MSYAIDTYQRRRRDKESWGAETDDLNALVKDSCDMFATIGGPYFFSVNHSDFGPPRPLSFVRRKLRVLLQREQPGTPIQVGIQKGDQFIVFVFRRVHRQVAPAPAGGSPDINIIHAAVEQAWGARGWGLFSVGLYVRKPGEHGATGYADGRLWHGNAEDWEFADSTQDTTVSDAKLYEQGQWLVAQRNSGLPVGGVICQGMAWSIFYNGWEVYKPGYDRFTRHFTHNHVSGETHDRLTGWF